LVALILLSITSAAALAQPGRPVGPRPGPSTGPEPAACACGVVGFLVAGLVALGLIALQIFLAVWISRDAKARGMDNPAMYVLLVIFLGWIGLIIYLTSRPQGALYPCPDCGQKRLEGSRRCPHCGSH
jgi:hypothetical protein